METAIVSVIIITVVLVGVLTVSYSYFSSQDAILTSWREMDERLGERVRTRISPIGAETISANKVEVTLKNEGETQLSDFDQWDVIVEYYEAGGGHIIEWLAYTEAAPLGNNEWTVEGIYLDASQATPEAYEPGIFNPEEEMVIQMEVSPPVGASTTNWATTATPNGISASTIFTR